MDPESCPSTQEGPACLRPRERHQTQPTGVRALPGATPSQTGEKEVSHLPLGQTVRDFNPTWCVWMLLRLFSDDTLTLGQPCSLSGVLSHAPPRDFYPMLS